MKELTITEIQQIIKDFCDDRDWQQYHTPKDLAIGMSTESNELLDLFRFKNDNECEQVVKNKNEEVCDEIVDIFYYVLRFAQLNNIDLTKEFLRKMQKNEQKYPIDKVKGKNLKYNEY